MGIYDRPGPAWKLMQLAFVRGILQLIVTLTMISADELRRIRSWANFKHLQILAAICNYFSSFRPA